jgi:hypothetical protein
MPRLILAPLLAFWVAAPPAGWADRHPQDGPDAELRVALRQDHLLVRVRLNLAFADAVLELERELENQVAESELPAYQDALAELLRTQLLVQADGKTLAFEAEPISWMPAIDGLVGMFPSFGARALAQLQLPLRFALESPPRRISLRWGLYPGIAPMAGGPEEPVQVTGQLNDGRYDHPLLFTQVEPEFTWHGEFQDPGAGFLPVPEAAPRAPRPTPWLSLALVGALCPLLAPRLRRPAAGLTVLTLALTGAALGRERLTAEWGLAAADAQIAPAEARAVFEALLKNLYTAFDYDRESDIYDALAQSAEGPLLARFYAQIYTALVLEDEGGAMARVESVTPLETALEAQGRLPGTERRSFSVRARWQLVGKVSHFGHSHARTTEYEARFSLAEAEGRWRIVGEEPLASRVVSAISTGG